MGNTFDTLFGKKNKSITNNSSNKSNLNLQNGDRTAYVLNRARNLLTNPKVLDKYKTVLKKLLDSNNVLFVEKLVTTASKGNKQVKDEFMGVTAANFSYIKIGGKCFNYWLDKGNSNMVDVQLDHTILHETRHVLLRNNNHPKGFDEEIGDMGFQYGY